MKKKKFIAPSVITAMLILYFAIIFVVCFCLPISLWIKIVVAIFMLVSVGISIFVLVERIKEIRSGEEDDLSKY